MSDEPTEIPLADLIAAADEVNDPAVFRVLDIVIAKRRTAFQDTGAGDRQPEMEPEPRPAT